MESDCEGGNEMSGGDAHPGGTPSSELTRSACRPRPSETDRLTLTGARGFLSASALPSKEVLSPRTPTMAWPSVTGPALAARLGSLATSFEACKTSEGFTFSSAGTSLCTSPPMQQHEIKDLRRKTWANHVTIKKLISVHPVGYSQVPIQQLTTQLGPSSFLCLHSPSARNASHIV